MPKMLVCGIKLHVHKLDSSHEFHIKEAKLFQNLEVSYHLPWIWGEAFLTWDAANGGINCCNFVVVGPCLPCDGIPSQWVPLQ